MLPVVLAPLAGTAVEAAAPTVATLVGLAITTFGKCFITKEITKQVRIKSVSAIGTVGVVGLVAIYAAYKKNKLTITAELKDRIKASVEVG